MNPDDATTGNDFGDIQVDYARRKSAVGVGVARSEMLAKHPDWAKELRQFFEDEDAVFGGAVQGMLDLKLPTAEELDTPVEAGELIAGRYRLVEEIGTGGMGTVWVALQSEPVKRKVAIKLIKPGMDSKAVLARFEQERQALAVMDHPNIARVFDGGMSQESGVRGQGSGRKELPNAGLTPDPCLLTPGAGRPFFAMELVAGKPLTKFCDEAKLPIRTRLELFAPICQAVQHAHQKGIIHRDLKPANILVTYVDGRPTPKIIDFGVAKAVSGKLTEESLMTQFGAVLGTLEYMAPEQAGMTTDDIDTRADIYSLGVILYELLTGLRPFDSERLRKAAFNEVVRILREEEPPSLASRLSTDESLPSVAAMRQIEPQRLLSLVKSELDWIVHKCLEKERGRRYGTASDLARDLERYLSHEPVEARPISAGYRLSKFLRRNKGPVLAATLVLAALLAGIAGTTWGLIRAEQRREEAELARANEAQQRQKAEQAEALTLADYQASTDDAIEQLIGSKPELGPKEKKYLELTLARWQAFAARQGDDERSRAIRGEGQYRIGVLWQRLGRREEARNEYQTARDVQTRLVEQFPIVPEYQRKLARTHNNLGIVLADLGKIENARVEFQAGRNLQQKLVEQFPATALYRQDLATTHNNRGKLFKTLGKFADARAEFHLARDLQKQLVEQFPAVPEFQQELVRTHNNLGLLLVDLGEWDAAQVEYKVSLGIKKKLVEQFPDVPAYQQELARTHGNLGALLRHLGMAKEARLEIQATRDLLRRLVEQLPAVPAYQQDLATTHGLLAAVLAGLGQSEEARTEYQAARDKWRKLVEQYPTVPGHRYELARTKVNLGILLADMTKREEAVSEYREARDIQKSLVEQFPSVLVYQVDLGGSYCNAAIMSRDEGKLSESLDWFERAIRTLNLVYAKQPRDVTVKRYLRNCHSGRARTFDRLNRPADAVNDWDRAIELSPPEEQPGFRASRAASELQVRKQ